MIPSESHDSRRELVRLLGLIVIIIGLLIAGYFTVFYETSVPGSADNSRIQNIGLLQNRQSGISGGLEFGILGALLMLYGKETS